MLQSYLKDGFLHLRSNTQCWDYSNYVIILVPSTVTAYAKTRNALIVTEI